MANDLNTQAALREQFDSVAGLFWTIWDGPGYHTRVPNGARVHPTRENLDFALALLRNRSPQDVRRAEAVIVKILALQDRDPTSATYGVWPWLAEEPLDQMNPPDLNWADFLGIRLARILLEFGPSFSTVVRSEMRIALGHAAWAIFRRNVGPGYTNIALMGAATTLAAGEILDDRRLVAYGRRRLRKLVEHTETSGEFEEYNSPTYTLLALDECENILDLVQDEAARGNAEWLRRAAWRTIAEHFHPATGQWAGPHSRTYRDLLAPDFLEHLLARRYACPDEYAERFETLPSDPASFCKRFVLGNTDAESIYGWTWLSGDACLGSANRSSLWNQRRPLLAYWRAGGGAVAVLRLRFLKDGRDFASASARVIQRDNRALSAVGTTPGMGDFHVSLDKPSDGLFHCSDLRVRYELTGPNARVEKRADGQFSLICGETRADLQTVPGLFDGASVKWRAAAQDGQAVVDAVCRSGPEKTLRIETLRDTLIAAAVEIVPAGQPPAAASITVETEAGGSAGVTWQIDPPLRLGAPLRPA